MLDVSRLAKIDSASKSIKTVRRTYSTKKGVKTTVYNYSKSLLLFKKTKTGYKLIDDAWNKFEESIRNEFGDSTDSTTIINEARRIKKDILVQKDTGVGKYGGSKHYFGGNLTTRGEHTAGWNRIDVKSMVSRLAVDQTEKFLLNMGLTSEEVIDYVASQAGVTLTREELLDPGRWNGETFYGEHVTLEIKFSYSGVNHINIKEVR